MWKPFHLWVIILLLYSQQQAFATVTTTTVWEIRQDAGDANNGACFDGSVAVPGTDYSQQASSQYNGTDLVIDGVDNTIVTSATHNFVAADEGNCIRISAGTGFTVGWYIITDTATNAATLSSAVGTVGSTGGTYRVGGAGLLNSTNADDIFEALIGGNKVWIKNNGTALTLGEAISIAATSCDADSPCFIEGYQTTRGDAPAFANAPMIDAAANNTTFGQYQMFRNLVYTSTTASGWAIGTNSVVDNVKATNTSTAASRVALTLNSAAMVLFSEFVSQNGTAVNSGSGSQSQVIGSYIHDSDIGIRLNSASSLIGNVIEANRTQGFNLTNLGGLLAYGNTFYGREAQISTCLDLNNAASINNKIFNNIFYGCTLGIDVDTAEQKSNVGNYNNFFNNGTDVARYTKGANALAVNPQFGGATQITGTTATTVGSVLTQSGGDFSTVTDNVDYLHVLSGTGVTTGGYLITSHDATTLTVNNALGTSSAGDVTYFVTTGHNFSVGTNLKATSAPATFGSETNNYLDTGAVQRQEPASSSGGSFPFVQ